MGMQHAKFPQTGGVALQTRSQVWAGYSDVQKSIAGVAP